MQDWSDQPSARAFVIGLLVWLASVLVLLWPLMLNGSVILFYDSAAYVSFGQKIWSFVLGSGPVEPGAGSGLAKATAQSVIATAGQQTSLPASGGVLSTGRSYFYSAAAWAARAGQGYAMIAVAQAAAMATVILLALHRFGVRSKAARLLTVILLALFTPLAFFVCTVMPDVFAGVGPLAVALLLFCYRDMNRAERTFWGVSLLAVILFHKAFLFLSIAMLLLALPFAITLRKGVAGGLVVIALIGVAWGADRVVVRAAQRVTDQTAVSVPFLVARGISDGTIAQVLQEDCKGSPSDPWVACVFLDALPMSDTEFLWGPRGLDSIAPEQQAAISGEQAALVLAAMTRYPAEQATRTVENILAQLFAVDLMEFAATGIKTMVAVHTPDPESTAAYAASPVANGTFPLESLSQFWRALYFCACAGSVVLLGMLSRDARRSTLPVAALWLLMLSVVVSAVITGGIAGVFGRYQARIAWIPSFVLCISAVWLLWGTRHSAYDPRIQAR